MTPVRLAGMLGRLSQMRQLFLKGKKTGTRATLTRRDGDIERQQDKLPLDAMLG